MTTTDPLFGMFLALAASPDQQVSPLIQLIPFALILSWIAYSWALAVTRARRRRIRRFDRARAELRA